MNTATFDSLAKINPSYGKALAYLNQVSLSLMALGRYPIEGDQIYLLIVENDARTRTTAEMEAHSRYTDIQIPLNKEIEFGWSRSMDCQAVKVPYSVEKDIVYYADAPQHYIRVRPGEMIVFTPADAHATDIGEGKVKKAVLKIRH